MSPDSSERHLEFKRVTEYTHEHNAALVKRCPQNTVNGEPFRKETRHAWLGTYILHHRNHRCNLRLWWHRLFFVFVVLFLLSLIAGLVRGKGSPAKV